MSKDSGSVFGGILLIAGSCVGAGMLGLPIQTGLAGLFPSLAAFLAVWVFMTLSGFFLLEVNSWHPTQANLLTMVSSSLGKVGRYVCWVFYLFLFYAVLVAYMAASGNILSHFLKSYFSLSISADSLILGFVIIFGAFIFLGTKVVDHANRYLMIGKIGSFLLVLFLGVKFIKPIHYTFINNSKLFPSLPILITAFGFHNMIPSLTTYMKGNIKKVKMSILGGSILSLFIYLLWQILVLGIIPVNGEGGLLSALKNGKEASELISSYVQTPSIGIVAQLLGFFAILTSFLAQSLSLSHFLDDGLQAKKTVYAQVGICALTLLPPLILALLFPNLFYTALNFAGGICTVVLFGIIPALMIWKGRYIKMVQLKKIIVPGGKPVITVVLLFASCIFLYEISSLIKIIFF